MKRKNLIIGSVSLVAVAAIIAAMPWQMDLKKGAYQKKDIRSLESHAADDARKWLEARYIDQATGQPITPEKLELVRKQFHMSAKSKNIAFEEQGPDNIGGLHRPPSELSILEVSRRIGSDTNSCQAGEGL